MSVFLFRSVLFFSASYPMDGCRPLLLSPSFSLSFSQFFSSGKSHVDVSHLE
jgi:hypothetical protein